MLNAEDDWESEENGKTRRSQSEEKSSMAQSSNDGDLEAVQAANRENDSLIRAHHRSIELAHKAEGARNRDGAIADHSKAAENDTDNALRSQCNDSIAALLIKVIENSSLSSIENEEEAEHSAHRDIKGQVFDSAFVAQSADGHIGLDTAIAKTSLHQQLADLDDHESVHRGTVRKLEHYSSNADVAQAAMDRSASGQVEASHDTAAKSQDSTVHNISSILQQVRAAVKSEWHNYIMYGFGVLVIVWVCCLCVCTQFQRRPSYRLNTSTRRDHVPRQINNIGGWARNMVVGAVRMSSPRGRR